MTVLAVQVSATAREGWDVPPLPDAQWCDTPDEAWALARDLTEKLTSDPRAACLATWVVTVAPVHMDGSHR